MVRREGEIYGNEGAKSYDGGKMGLNLPHGRYILSVSGVKYLSKNTESYDPSFIHFNQSR